MAASVEGDALVFRYRDPGARLRGVRLQQDVRLPGELLDFTRDGQDWVLRVDLDTRRWFDVADSDAAYADKLATYRTMADDYFETDRYAEFVATQLADLDAVAVDYFGSADFDRLLVETVRSTFPGHEHEQFVAHYRGLVGAWVADASRAG